MNNKIIIEIEGTDGSGKETQSKLLNTYFSNKGKKTLLLSFPQYDNVSSEYVKSYLRGDYTNLTPIQISLLYAYDRYISYINEWKKEFDEAEVIIFDRYVDSNIIYNTTYEENASTTINLANLYNFTTQIHAIEYEKMGLPIPTVKLFLNVPYEVSKKLRENRKLKNGESVDINEQNEKLMKKVSYMANLVPAIGYEVIDCIENGEMRNILSIHESIINVLEKTSK